MMPTFSNQQYSRMNKDAKNYNVQRDPNEYDEAVTKLFDALAGVF